MPDRARLAQSGNDMVLAPGQDLVLVDSNGRPRLRLDASDGTITVTGADGDVSFSFQAGRANLWLGGAGRDGDLLLTPSAGTPKVTAEATVHLDANAASFRLGAGAKNGRISVQGPDHRVEIDGGNGRLRATRSCDVRTSDNDLRIRLDANGSAVFGGNGSDGRIVLKDSANKSRVRFDAKGASAAFGGAGEAGEVSVRDTAGRRSIHINGSSGNVGLGTANNAGALKVRNASGKDSILLDGSSGNVDVGRKGTAGLVRVRDDNGRTNVLLDGDKSEVHVGAAGAAGDVFLRDNDGDVTIRLNGQEGDILISNGDCAEEFDVPAGVTVEPGLVVIIDEDEQVRPATAAYDRRVAGVVAGAGEYRPAIVLDRRETGRVRTPVALMGKVYCRVDARYGAIQNGDLLTSSETPGHAMRASDPARTAGAVVGKALRPLAAGVGLIPILTTLQ